jgi:hypothetical protein
VTTEAAGWDIPALDIALQATKIETPVVTWGSIGRTRPMPGTYALYTDDFKFSALWKGPDRLVDSGCKVAVEMNWSTFDDSDPEEVLELIYRKRVISAYWQSKGVKILVDLDVAPNYLDDYALLGVPRGWRAYATRSHRLSQMNTIEDEYEVAVEHAGTSEILFAVFGGGKKVDAACKERNFIHVPEHIEVVRGRALPFQSDFELKL